MSIGEGEFYALMGPNGSGKSTLVSIIASIILPTSGEVKVYELDALREGEGLEGSLAIFPKRASPLLL